MLSFSPKRSSKKTKEISKKEIDLSNNETWLTKYSPDAKDELAMHITKVNAITDWINMATKHHKEQMENSNNNNIFKPHILALCGISGSCKSTVVEVLCKELGINLNVWSEDSWEPDTTSDNYATHSMSYDYRNNVDNNHYNANKNMVIELFQDNKFNKKSLEFNNFNIQSTYNSLDLFSKPNKSRDNINNNNNNINNNNNNNNNSSIILMHDIPSDELNSFSTVMTSFRDPVIIIISNVSERDDFYYSADKALPKTVQDKVNFEKIYCQPISTTRMTNVLQKILDKEGYKHISKQQLKDISINSLGDLRHSIIQLQIICEHSIKNNLINIKNKDDNKNLKSKSKKRNIEEISSSIIDSNISNIFDKHRDCSYGPLHAVSKIIGSKLNIHGKLEFEPDLFIERCNMDTNLMTSFMQFNSLASIIDIHRVESCHLNKDFNNKLDDSIKLDIDKTRDVLDVDIDIARDVLDTDINKTRDILDICETRDVLDIIADSFQYYSDIDYLCKRKYDSNSIIDRSNNAGFPDDYIGPMCSRLSAVSRGAGCLERGLSGKSQGNSYTFLSIYRPKILELSTLSKRIMQNQILLRNEITSPTIIPQPTSYINKTQLMSSISSLFLSNDEISITYIPYLRSIISKIDTYNSNLIVRNNSLNIILPYITPSLKWRIENLKPSNNNNNRNSLESVNQNIINSIFILHDDDIFE